MKLAALKRPERRRALIAAAAAAFAGGGFAATSLDDVARRAGVSKVLIYRHFASKAELYEAVLVGVRDQLVQATGDQDRLSDDSLKGLVSVARENPEGFQLFFRQAGHEPEFRQHADWLRAAMIATAEPYLREAVPAGPRHRWAAQLVPTAVIEAVLAWLDAGQPDPDIAADTIAAMVAGLVTAIADGAPAGSRQPSRA